MSASLVEQRYHPLLAWLLLILVLSMVGVFIILPALAASQALAQQIENGYDRLNKMRQAIVSAPNLEAEYQRVRQQGLDKLFYPASMTAAQVGKELQNQLAEVVRRHQGLMLSSELVDQRYAQDESVEQSDYQPITVQASFQGSMVLLRDVLNASDQARPLMFVEALELRPVADQGENTQILRSTLRVSSYWRGRTNYEKTP